MVRLFALLLLAAVLLLPSASSVFAAGSISGVLWEDTNIDGVRHPEERGMRQFPVRLSGAATAEAFTDDTGAFRFEGLAPGTYTVSVPVPPFGLAPFSTYPTRDVTGPFSQTVTISGDASVEVNFGLVGPGSVQRGTAWINADQPNRPQIAAFQGGTQCGFPANYLFPPHTQPGSFVLYYPPPGFLDGCGPAGAPISFTINGQRANETSVYPPASLNNTGVIPPNLPQPVNLNLTLGPAFATYFAEMLVLPEGVYVEGNLKALIGGVDCAVRQPTQGGYYFTVLPAALKPGCGSEGAKIDFFIGETKTNETATWTPGTHELQLSVPESAWVRLPGAAPYSSPTATPAATGGTGITPPDTGDAGLK